MLPCNSYSRPSSDSPDFIPTTVAFYSNSPHYYRPSTPRTSPEDLLLPPPRAPHIGPQPSPSLSPPSWPDRCVHGANVRLSGRMSPRPASPLRLDMPPRSLDTMALSCLEVLPVPILVLDHLKIIVFANHAMNKLLGLSRSLPRTPSPLLGLSLSQAGIDIHQPGQPLWISWDAFFESIARDEHWSHTPGMDAIADKSPSSISSTSSDTLSTSPASLYSDPSVDVVIAKIHEPFHAQSQLTATEPSNHVCAKMIVTPWESATQQSFFNLTFTGDPQQYAFSRFSSSFATPISPSSNLDNPLLATPTVLHTVDAQSPAAILHSPISDCNLEPTSPVVPPSPRNICLYPSPFPPPAPPSMPSAAKFQPSVLQKLTTMKDALLDNTGVPVVAMWKDGSVSFPNKAARALFYRKSTPSAPPTYNFADTNFVTYLHNSLPSSIYTSPFWTGDFSRRLEPQECPLLTLLETQQPFKGVRVGLYLEDGQRATFNAIGEAIRDNNTGEFLAGVVTYHSVTDLTQEITQIKEGDAERFQTICDAMPQLVWRTDSTGRIQDLNKRWYEYTGISLEETKHLVWERVVHPDDIGEFEKQWAHSMATGEPFSVEHRILQRSGEWLWFLSRALPVRNKRTGAIEQWFGASIDVHSRYLAAQESNRFRQQLLSVLTHARVTLFSVDTSRKVTMLEGSLIWDTPQHDTRTSPWFLDQNVCDVFEQLTSKEPTGKCPAFLEPIDDILEGVRKEAVVEHRFGGRSYRTHLMPMWRRSRADGTNMQAQQLDGVIGTIVDITELREREEAIEQEAKRKRQAMANEAAAKEASRLKSQFLANMSHEIRTPISGVLGMTEVLARTQLDDEQSECLGNIRRSAEALLTVINDILDFSKIESGRLELRQAEFSLPLMVTDVGKMLQFGAWEKGLEFVMEVADDVSKDLVVVGDMGRVCQIIINLLTNSIKFTHRGFVRLCASRVKETEDLIWIRFVVEDTGIGIHDDVRNRLYRPFTQGDPSTARRFGGTGLGLTICKNLLDLMGGEIQLESTLGQGTTVSVVIPFGKPNGQSETRPPSPISSPALAASDSPSLLGSMGVMPPRVALRHRKHGSLERQLEVMLPKTKRSQIHVLIVEDNQINQKIALKLVKMLGFTASAVWNGEEALRYLRDAQEGTERKPNVILMDVQMPLIDGYRCTQVLRQSMLYRDFACDIPVVALTASAIEGDRERCLRAGMDDYLAKPITSSHLEEILVRWCLSRRNPGASVLEEGDMMTE